MPTVLEIFQQTELSTDDIIYTYIKLPSRAITVAAGVIAQLGEAFSALIVDKDEVSLMIAEDAVEEFEKRLLEARQEGHYRLITFESVLEFDLVGFFAIVTELLANADISILAFSAFSRDHVLVPADKFEQAWSTLKTAQVQSS